MEVTGSIESIQYNQKLVWFTGGLDSTYSLQQMLNKNYESIGVGYIFHGGFSLPRCVDEIITRRVILNQLKEKNHLGLLNEQEIYVTSDNTLASSSVVKQAVTIANASVQTLLTLSFRRPKHLPDIVIGWHKDDVRERSLNIGDFTSSQYKDLVNYIKIGLNTFNDKDFTVGDLLFLTKTNADFINSLVKRLFPESNRGIASLLLKETLESKTIAKFNDFFITDNKPWMEVIDLNKFKTEVSNKFEDRKRAIAEAEETAKALKEAQLKNMKENSSFVASPVEWRGDSRIDRLTSMKGHKPEGVNLMSNKLVIPEKSENTTKES